MKKLTGRRMLKREGACKYLYEAQNETVFKWMRKKESKVITSRKGKTN